MPYLNPNIFYIRSKILQCIDCLDKLVLIGLDDYYTTPYWICNNYLCKNYKNICHTFIGFDPSDLF
jgi:hypothetical protein